MIAFLVPYDLIRMVASDDRGPALAHARAILGLERHLGLHVEAPLNAAVTGVRWAELATSFWYAGLHYLVTPLVLIALYRFAPERYRPARSALMLATAVALVGYLAYPTAPPRMLPGYVDTMIATADVGWWPDHNSAGLNQLAAMPSMHVGWALWCGLVLAGLARHRWQRLLAHAYPLVTTVVVVATANHWTLDAVAGAVLVLGAWWLLVHRRRAVRAPEPVGLL
ncbi:phosphatase PAP2 family protein [Cryptosporangium aurantiacum]|uniref:phosphatase PAP2 family protein n=1 Tax=Cryptosporangium aurantiacum TaxID=134849 RepID=UPI00116148BA|nr:phosphatase PAP2 family protein [Cryptosporangium aurantiacum]